MNKTNEENDAIMEFSDYFTDDIRESIANMSNQEMKDSLRELESTHYWIALLKYSQDRILTIQNALLSVDPEKATTIARYQGIASGIIDPQEAIIRLKNKSNREMGGR
jgi:hypothetical protein